MTIVESHQAIVPNPSFRKQVESLSGEIVSACFQCEKCTNGCPITFAMDIPPHKLIRSVHLGLKDYVLNSNTIWVCASCETCTTRCPNNIDIAHIMDSLRQISQHEGVKPSQKDVPAFHSAFLSSVRRHGKIYEMEMTIAYYLKTTGLAGLFNQASLGLDMFRKGKLRILPPSLRANPQIRNIFNKTKENS